MSDWISVALWMAGSAVTIVATAIKMTWWLGDRLDKITSATTGALNQHEEKDNERHKELLVRITRVETRIEENATRARRYYTS